MTLCFTPVLAWWCAWSFRPQPRLGLTPAAEALRSLEPATTAQQPQMLSPHRAVPPLVGEEKRRPPAPAEAPSPAIDGELDRELEEVRPRRPRAVFAEVDEGEGAEEAEAEEQQQPGDPASKPRNETGRCDPGVPSSFKRGRRG